MSGDDSTTGRPGLDDTDQHTGPASANRRAVLRSLGIGVAATVPLTGVGSATATGGDDHSQTEDGSDISCATGPFERTYEAFEQSTATAPPATILSEMSDEELAAMEPRDAPSETPRREDPVDGSVPPAVEAVEPPSLPADAGEIDIEREFDGIVDPFSVPSDANIAAGPDDLVVALNSAWAVFGKDGTLRGAFDLRGWFEDAIDRPETAFVRVFDPWVRYDPDAGRFYLVSTFLDENTQGYMLLSVSADSDPMGTWYNYGVRPIGPDAFQDFEALGFDSEAVYITENNLNTGAQGRRELEEVTLTILDKQRLGNGEQVTASIFKDLRDPDGSKAFTVRPADQPLLDGDADSDRPYFMLNADVSLQQPDFGAGNSLTLWSVTDPLGDPTLSCESVPVSPFTLNPFSPQPGTDVLLSTRDTRLLTMVYDEFDDTLWTAHTIGQDWTGDGTIVSAIQWFEVDPFEGEVVQSGLWGEPGRHYYYPAVSVNETGMQMVYSVSGPDTFARMDVAGRTDDFTPGEIEASTVVQEGESPYTNFDPQPVDGFEFVRWGDYWSVAVDPESNTFWSIAQYSPQEDPDLPPNLDLYATRIAETSFTGSTTDDHCLKHWLDLDHE